MTFPNNPSNPYRGKQCVVFGLGRSGIAAARLLLRSGADVTVSDHSESETVLERAAALRGEGAHVVTGRSVESLHSEKPYDLAILSPGIEETAPSVARVTAQGTPLIGELELAFTLCPCPVVAITGTNGKTTTTELTVCMLRGAGFRTASCGNIGTPMSEMLSSGQPLDVLVAEVSSFQLETIRSFRPKVSVWLNLSPNHLDRYPSMKEYRAAKLRIFENQREEDIAVLPVDSDLPVLRPRRITFSPRDPSADITLRGNVIHYRGERLADLDSTRLKGEHNASNMMAAFGVGIALGADPEPMAAAIRTYVPPSHRCELIAEKRGVRWINDSKATNLDAMEQAIRSVQGPLVLIAGGKDKGFEFSPIEPLVRERVGFAVLIGEMRERIARDWALTPSAKAESLPEAVSLACRMAVPGSTVLFSPGTSSFDMFRDYIERGEAYRELVLGLPEKNASSSP
jgi:UDP-N-acetylmuramoylalanine--D-glutamate ligase